MADAAELFEGIDEALAYEGKGNITNSCQAVNFATLFGLNDFNEVDFTLRAQGFTDENGITTLPSEGGEIDLGMGRVILGEQSIFFGGLQEALEATQTAFSEGKAIQFSTMIPGSDGEPVMHPILFVGHVKDDETVTKVYIGDSRTDGVSEISPEYAMTIIEVAGDDVGVIIGQTIEPSSDYGEASADMSYHDLNRLVTRQVYQTEILERCGAPEDLIRATYASLSRTEEAIASHSDSEKVAVTAAQIGAMQAAVRAGDLERAEELAARYKVNLATSESTE